MKRVKIVSIAVTSTVVLVLAAAFLAAAQQPGQKDAMKSMGSMSMDGMIKECNEHHQAMTKSVDGMSKTLEGAKQSNDPAKMRAAIDHAQKQLREMKEHMAMCGNMMNMMQKMQGGKR